MTDAYDRLDALHTLTDRDGDTLTLHDAASPLRQPFKSGEAFRVVASNHATAGGGGEVYLSPSQLLSVGLAYVAAAAEHLTEELARNTTLDQASPAELLDALHTKVVR